MKIDRSRFLVLTAALAAPACIVVDHPAAPPPAPPPPPPAAHPASGGVVSVHTPPPATPAPATPPPGHVVLRPAPRPAPGPAPVSPTPSPSPAPAACLDGNATTVPSCTASCSSNAFVAQRCATYAATFDPKVSASAISCMNGLTGANACDSMQAYNCGKTALSQACPDNTVSQLCQIAATPCKVAQNDCVTMLSGLNAAGQDSVAQCVAKGCTGGLYSCIEGLSPTAQALMRR